ncbi:hypothetical protein AMTR_s00037p00208050 [Amborella trichopoda]|uniref:Uncharacterized protein n=1 Tax=Amborella trichopoda TaxID=13333 RepID=U5CVP4_AMBTC|nr:hypothetical protein AMTR_s00037p00208050 [Amborella trichopoda]
MDSIASEVARNKFDDGTIDNIKKQKLSPLLSAGGCSTALRRLERLMGITCALTVLRLSSHEEKGITKCQIVMQDGIDVKPCFMQLEYEMSIGGQMRRRLRQCPAFAKCFADLDDTLSQAKLTAVRVLIAHEANKAQKFYLN